jgi:hypothetical protein
VLFVVAPDGDVVDGGRGGESGSSRHGGEDTQAPCQVGSAA